MKNLIPLLSLFLVTQSFALDPPTSPCGPHLLPDTTVLTAEQVVGLAMPVNSLGGYTKISKFLIDVRNPDAPRAVFFDTGRFQYHHEFATNELGYRGDLAAFQEFNYTGSYRGREFILASLVIKEVPGEAPESMIELFSGDDMDVETIQMMMRAVHEKVNGFSSIRFHPLSVTQENNAASALDASHVILTRDLAAGLSYLPLNPGTTYGYVRLVKKSDYEAGTVLLGPADIAVFDQVPNDIGLVAGVVTEELQTALSHINIKSINRGTANLYLKDASTQLKKYKGKAIRLDALETGLSTTLLEADEADRLIAEFWSAKKKKLTEKPAFLLDPKLEGKLLDLTDLYKTLPSKDKHRKLVQTIGAKAANLALLRFIVKDKKLEVKVPETMAIPFNSHQAFLKKVQKGLDPKDPKRRISVEGRIKEILNQGDLLNPNKIHPIETVVATLKEVREMISKAAVPDETIAVLKKKILDDTSSPIHISKHTRLRFRSSTNSEDMEGFTGAGLYDSYGVNLYKKLDSGGYDRESPRKWEKIEEDLRESIAANYASIFNERAFMEREWFGINGKLHLDIRAGIAIHTAFPFQTFDGAAGEIGNGVAITTDLYREKSDYPKIFMNSQHYDLSITNPPEAADLIRVGERTGAAYSTEETIVSAMLANMAEDASEDAWLKWPVDRVRLSSVKGGEPVLKVEAAGGEIRKLARAIRVINQEMAKVFGQEEVDEFPIDVEYKIYGAERTLYIKQARPFVRPQNK